MRDKRPVDELSIEELEKILAIRKREARLARVRRYEGRRIAAGGVDEIVETPETAPEAEPEEQPSQAEMPQVYFDDTPRFEDELEERRLGRTPARGKGRSVAIWNRLLTLVEITAAIGLVFLFASLFQSLQEVSQTTANIQAQYQATANARLVTPTATPVIRINKVVLPVGHKVTVNSSGQVVSASFNLDEVPAQYRDQYLAMLSEPLVQPTQSAEGPLRVQIPRIKVDSTVVSGDGWRELQLGVGHHIGSANPGERGNMVLSAHNDVYGEIFRYLDRLQPGDTVTVSTLTKDYTYVVRDTRIVAPDDVWVLESQGDERKVTLISCYPYQVDNKRIVVFATLQTETNS